MGAQRFHAPAAERELRKTLESGSVAATAADFPPADWPSSEYSQVLSIGKIRWHYQRAGSGPVLLLLHGTGSSTHSWRGLLPRLVQHYTVIAPDLPGHGFTHCKDKNAFTLPGMANAVADLLAQLECDPEMGVGHSAGAALLIRMTLDDLLSPRIIIGLNAALLPFGGVLTSAFQPMARLFASLPVLPAMLARRAGQPGSVERLIAGTGSRLGEQGISDYRQVLSREDHVAATLAMMANWNLQTLLHEFRHHPVPLHLLVSSGDLTILPAQADRVRAICPGTQIQKIPGLGHLAHEEDPQSISGLIRAIEQSGD